MKKLFAAALVAVMCLAFAGCGGSSGYSQGEQFQLGDETYALEKWERNIDKDTLAELPNIIHSSIPPVMLMNASSSVPVRTSNDSM